MTVDPSPLDPAQIRSQVHFLYNACQQDDWSLDRAKELAHLVATSDIARQLYVDLVHQRASLRLMLGPAIPLESRTPPSASPPEHDTLGCDIPLLQLGGDDPPSSCSGTPWPTPFSLFGLVLATGVLLTVVGLWWHEGWRASTSTSPRPLGAVASAGTPEMQIGALNIESGTVRIKLPQVGNLIVEGPSKLALASPMRLELHRGKIKLHVTEASGHGFVVATPHGEITDLGTEFGVDATREGASDLVVFDGAVDLRLSGADDAPARFTRGEGVRFNSRGELDRIMSITMGNAATFSHPSATAPLVDLSATYVPIIVDVEDNRRARQTHRFYEIVQRGLTEGSSAYVDRRYTWSGAGESHLPHFLHGADYIKTFNDDKVADVTIRVSLSGPAHLYLFWDDRVPPTPWLEKQFERLPLMLDLEEGQVQDPATNQPHDIVRSFSIWHRDVAAEGIVELGSMELAEDKTAMYGIAASRVAPSLPAPNTF